MSKYVQEISKINLLSLEETDYLVKAKQEGNLDARNKLIEHNLRIVLKLAFQFKKTIDLPIEDLISIGIFGLLQAVDNYRLNEKTKLSSYAFRCISNYYIRYLEYVSKKARNFSEDVSLLTTVVESEKRGRNITLQDALANEDKTLEDVVIEKIEAEKIRQLLSTLTKREQVVICLRYGIPNGLCLTHEKISQIIGDISRERVRQIDVKARQKLKKFEYFFAQE